jgi:hypothetical protein
MARESFVRVLPTIGRLHVQAVVVQWGARRHGNAGTYGNDGNVVSVSYRIYRR